MKASDYIAEFLKKQGLKHVFGVTGGVITPLIDSLYGRLEFICSSQEQPAAIEAESYSRITKNLGVAIATSGPGATNLITGIGCAWFDSIPALYISGQVDVNDTTYKNGPRQIGFQETNIVDIVKPITKFSYRIDNPKEVQYILEKAVYIAKSERPGPVLIDLPINVQLENINPAELKHYKPLVKKYDYSNLDSKINQTIELIKDSKRPVIILGNGIHLANYESKTRELVEKLGIPIALSWGAMDLLPYDHPLLIEGFGVSYNRAGNFAVQNSDLLISIGSRLDTRQTGIKRDTFAREAKKVVVDIDKGELYKGRGMNIDVDINYDLRDFIDNLSRKNNIKVPNLSEWKDRIRDWKIRYPICKPEYFEQKDKVNPYVFMDALSRESKEGDIIITDAGGNLTWTMQGFKVKQGQRLFSAFGNSPMGYSMCASIGACFASEKKPVTCIIGDGGLKMNINELEVIERHQLPIKIFLINNHEYGIIKQFQDTWFNSRYRATDYEGGLGDADLLKIARAYGIETEQINNHSELNKIRNVLDYNGAIMCSVELKHGEKITPKLEFGRSIEDPWPNLSDEEFAKNMIIKYIRK